LRSFLIERATTKLKYLSADLGDATIRNSQAPRGGERKIKDAAANHWPTVRDTDHYRLAGCKIGDANSRAERQAAVRCGWQIPIERSTARCFSCPI
jgi:hypothetical protein